VIYLFCNQGFGRKFLELARRFSREHHTSITIVFSDKAAATRRRNLYSDMSLRIRHTVARWRFACHDKMPLLIVEDVNSPRFHKKIHPSDHGIVAGFNQIFREETIRRFMSLVNFHPSILPLYRGPVPSYWCLVNGESTTGFTLHEVTRRIDEGKILAQGIVPVGSIGDPDILDQKIAKHAMDVFSAYLRQLQTGEGMNGDQVDAKAIYRRHISYLSFPK